MRARLTFAFVLLPLAAGCDWGHVQEARPEDRPFSGMYPFIEDGRLGFLDAGGEVKVRPQFSTLLGNVLDADLFSEDLAPMPSGTKWGYIDRQGSYAVNPQFDAAQPFRDGLARVTLDEKVGFIGRDGAYAINPQFDAAGDFAGGLAPVRLGEQWGYVDRKGTYVMNPQFQVATEFVEGVAAVRQNDRWGFVDREGAFVINPQFDHAYPFREERAVVGVRGGEGRYQFGIIDRKGKYVVNPQFDGAGEGFSDGLLHVVMGERHGYVDEDGKIVINPQFDDAGDFREGLAPVRSGAKWGYVGRDGALAINPQFDEAAPFSEGLARVRTGRQYGYIDAGGALVIRPQFVDAGLRFKGGHTWVVTEAGLGYIGKNGAFTRRPAAVARVTSLAQLDTLFARTPASLHASLVSNVRANEDGVLRAAGFGSTTDVAHLDAAGQAVTGVVQPGDGRRYTLILYPGQSVTALMRSPEFDTQLRLYRMGNDGQSSQLVAANDDWRSIRDSRIDYTSEVLAIYVLEVGSYYGASGGAFTLRVGAREAVEAQDASAPVQVPAMTVDTMPPPADSVAYAN